MRVIIGRLARVPLAGVGFAVLLSSVLIVVHLLLVRQIQASGQEEPPQWLGRLIGMYWGLLPLAFLALWARRRDRQGVLGRIGAAMLAVGPVLAVLLAVATAVWGGLLGRGDLPESVMWVESLFYVMMLGVLVSGVAFLLDAGVRWYGAFMVVGLLSDFVVPFALATVLGVFGILLMVSAVRSARRGAGVEAAVGAAR